MKPHRSKIYTAQAEGKTRQQGAGWAGRGPTHELVVLGDQPCLDLILRHPQSPGPLEPLREPAGLEPEPAWSWSRPLAWIVRLSNLLRRIEADLGDRSLVKQFSD
jgi:hypothetical protein